MILARSRSPAVLTTSAALGALAAHAHVERAVEAEREAASGGVELHRRNAEIEHDAVDCIVKPASRAIDVEIGKSILDQCQTASGLLDQIGAESDGGLVAIDADHACIGRREDCAGVAARAERAVDVDTAVTRLEQLDRRAAEHGNVEGRSASDSRAAAARHHSRAPGASRAATWDPSSPLSARTFWVASASSLWKRPGSQI